MAGRQARQQGASQTEPVHLLAGLLAEEQGRAAGLLRLAGREAADLLRMLGFSSPAPPPDALLVSLSPAAADLLLQARRLAGLSAEHMVASEHLLAALIQHRPLRQQLQGLGLGLTRVEEELSKLAAAPPVQLDEPLHLGEQTEAMDTARILDAAANRAREGLRVVEDYCRFALDDAFLTGELKQLRHDLASACATLPASLEARETQHDVGTALSTDQERERHSLREVAQVNFKRLQEALRTLEEYGKLQSPILGEAVERLRYRSYTLERAILLGATARERLARAQLYVLLTSSTCSAALDWTIQEAAAGGAQIIQLREKGLADRELIERARDARRWTRQAGVLFIVNDRADLARLVEADGVHLGQDDLPVKEARRILGPDALIGVSTHNLEQVRRAILDGASYIGVGPTFPSATKEFAELAGLDFVRQALAETTLPAFVIGGITLKTIDEAIAAGARRVAVSQAIAQADDPRAVAAALRQKLESSGNR